MYNELFVKYTEELNEVKVSEVKLTTRVDALSEKVTNQMMLKNDNKNGKILYW